MNEFEPQTEHSFPDMVSSGGAPLTCWLHLPQCGPILAFQLQRKTALWLTFTLVPAMVPGTFSRAVSQAATFQLYLCVRLFFPKYRTLQFCLLNFGSFPVALVHRFLKMLWIKTLTLNVSAFPPWYTVLAFSSKYILPYDPAYCWRWGTMSDPEQIPWFSLCYWLSAGLWAIDYREPSAQAVFSISSSSVSP